MGQKLKRDALLSLIDGLSPKPQPRKIIVSEGARRAAGVSRPELESIVGEAVRCDTLEPPNDFMTTHEKLAGVVRVGSHVVGVAIEEDAIRVVAVRRKSEAEIAPPKRPLSPMDRADLRRLDEATDLITNATPTADLEQIEELIGRVERLSGSIGEALGKMSRSSPLRSPYGARHQLLLRLGAELRKRRGALREERRLSGRVRDENEILRSACERLGQLGQEPRLKLGKIRACWKALGGALGQLESEADAEALDADEFETLRKELDDLRLFEATAADLAASLGAGPVEVQTPEQFAAPPPPEPKRPRKRR